jgi:hypothetical protein
MNRFFIYEEYGAKYELMIKDVAAAHRTMPGWLSYQKGLEVLASSLGSADNRGNQARKALTTGDLLVKVGTLRPDLMATADPASQFNGCASIHCSSPSYSSTRP